MTSLADYGFKVVGELPRGLPDFQLARRFECATSTVCIPLAFACLLLAYVESVSAGRALAQTQRLRDRSASGIAGTRRGESGSGSLPGLSGRRGPLAVVGE